MNSWHCMHSYQFCVLNIKVSISLCSKHFCRFFWPFEAFFAFWRCENWGDATRLAFRRSSMASPYPNFQQCLHSLLGTSSHVSMYTYHRIYFKFDVYVCTFFVYSITRGICYFNVEVSCASKDLHSGVFGGTV